MNRVCLFSSAFRHELKFTILKCDLIEWRNQHPDQSSMLIENFMGPEESDNKTKIENKHFLFGS